MSGEVAVAHLRGTEAGNGRAVALGGPCDLLRVGRDEDVVEDTALPGAGDRVGDQRMAGERRHVLPRHPLRARPGRERGRPRLARGDRIPSRRTDRPGDALDRDRGVRRALPGAARPPRPGHASRSSSSRRCPAPAGTLLSQLFDGHPECHAHPHELRIGSPTSRHWPPTRPGATRRVVRAAARAVCLEALRGAATGNPPASGPTAVATWTSSRSSSCRCLQQRVFEAAVAERPGGRAPGRPRLRTSPRTSTPGSTTRRCTRSRSRW